MGLVRDRQAVRPDRAVSERSHGDQHQGPRRRAPRQDANQRNRQYERQETQLHRTAEPEQQCCERHVPSAARADHDRRDCERERGEHSVEQRGSRIGNEKTIAGHESRREQWRAPATKCAPGEYSRPSDARNSEQQPRKPPSKRGIAERVNRERHEQLAERRVIVPVGATGEIVLSVLDEVMFVPGKIARNLETLGAQPDPERDHRDCQRDEQRVATNSSAGHVEAVYIRSFGRARLGGRRRPTRWSVCRRRS